MNRRIALALATGALLLGGNVMSAEDRDATKPMHMHKSDMDHRSDKEVATEYKSEAAQLLASPRHGEPRLGEAS